jgi:hypothetical protein
MEVCSAAKLQRSLVTNRSLNNGVPNWTCRFHRIQETLHHPVHLTKALLLAPVCVISPARCPAVLKMTRSAPGDPNVNQLAYSTPSNKKRHTTSVSTGSQQRVFLVRASNEEVEAFVVVVCVRVGRATSLIALAVVFVAGAAGCADLS